MEGGSFVVEDGWALPEVVLVSEDVIGWISIYYLFKFVFLVVYFFGDSKVELILGHQVNYIVKLDVCEVVLVQITH